MKYSDIKFGELHAIEVRPNQIHAGKVIKRIAPAENNSRSRLYLVEIDRMDLNRKGGHWKSALHQPTAAATDHFHVDASKILMHWSDYEKTDQHQEAVAKARVWQARANYDEALHSWRRDLEDRLKVACDHQYNGVNVYIDEPISVEEIKDIAFRQSYLVRGETLFSLVGNILPDTDAIEDALKDCELADREQRRVQLEQDERSLQFEIEIFASIPPSDVEERDAAHIRVMAEYNDDMMTSYTQGITTSKTRQALTSLLSVMDADACDGCANIRAIFTERLLERQEFKWMIPYLFDIDTDS